MWCVRQVDFGSVLYGDTCRLRDAVLRRPLGLSLTEDDVADDKFQIHIAALADADGMIGCVSLKKLDQGTIKLRQMAVADRFRGTGVGRDLVKFAENLAREQKFHRIDLHARLTAQGFYEKLGYLPVGEVFMELNDIPHIKMRSLL